MDRQIGKKKKRKRKKNDREKTVCVHILCDPEISLQASGTVKQNKTKQVHLIAKKIKRNDGAWTPGGRQDDGERAERPVRDA